MRDWWVIGPFKKDGVDPDAYRAALEAARLTPSAVDQWAMATGRPRAGRMPRDQRAKLLDFVKTPGGAAKIAAHHTSK